ncbi:hypothetical protein OG418_48900 [Streptomyces phaeochromogenes]|uniref:hypothetical protein n=1 Tax=Streptomyces phaeochromogenes TaxID=1923 RepID=UPI0032500814
MMSRESDPSSAPGFSPQELVHDVLTCFDAYARIRGGRDSIFPASRTTPQQEQRAFDHLAQAIDRLRSTIE